MANRLPVARYIERLEWAEALVFCFPTWNFGPPAMLKGFFDRVLIPGVAFDMSDGKKLRPALTHIRRIAAVVTYGAPRWKAFMMGDPPRKAITHHLRLLTGGRAKVDYHACYHMNVATRPKLERFTKHVGLAMAQFG